MNLILANNHNRGMEWMRYNVESKKRFDWGILIDPNQLRGRAFLPHEYIIVLGEQVMKKVQTVLAPYSGLTNIHYVENDVTIPGKAITIK